VSRSHQAAVPALAPITAATGCIPSTSRAALALTQADAATACTAAQTTKAHPDWKGGALIGSPPPA